MKSLLTLGVKYVSQGRRKEMKAQDKLPIFSTPSLFEITPGILLKLSVASRSFKSTVHY